MKKLPSLPKTKPHEERFLFQAEISKELWEIVQKEMKARKLTKRQVLEYGVHVFILQANPKEAERLGIKVQEG